MKGTTGIKIRREGAKLRLEAQLKSNVKREKINGKTTDKLIPLTSVDIARINREIDAINNPKKK